MITCYHHSLFRGRKGGIRTRDLLVPNQARYQAALLPAIQNRIEIVDHFRANHLGHPF